MVLDPNKDYEIGDLVKEGDLADYPYFADKTLSISQILSESEVRYITDTGHSFVFDFDREEVVDTFDLAPFPDYDRETGRSLYLSRDGRKMIEILGVRTRDYYTHIRITDFQKKESFVVSHQEYTEGGLAFYQEELNIMSLKRGADSSFFFNMETGEFLGSRRDSYLRSGTYLLDGDWEEGEGIVYKTLSRDYSVLREDLKTGEVKWKIGDLGLLGGRTRGGEISISPEEDLVAIGSTRDNDTLFVDIETGEIVASVPKEDTASRSSSAYFLNNKNALVTNHYNRAFVFNIETQEQASISIGSNGADLPPLSFVDNVPLLNRGKYYQREQFGFHYLGDSTKVHDKDKFLVRKGEKILYPTPDGLKLTPTQKLDRDMFAEYGTEDLEEISQYRDIEVLVMRDLEKQEVPIARVGGHTAPQLIKALGDIRLGNVKKVNRFDLEAEGNVRLLFSIDSGKSWQVMRDKQTIEVDIDNLEEVATLGMTPSEFNSLQTDWSHTIVTAGQLRFAYYLEDTTAEVDKLTIEVDMFGEWRSKRNKENNLIKFNNERITVSLFEDGTYKINYN